MNSQGNNSKRIPRASKPNRVPRWLANPMLDGRLIVDRFVNADNFESPVYLIDGTMSRVLLAKYKQTGKYFALKAVKKKWIYQNKSFDEVARELSVHTKTSHRFIVNIFRVFDAPSFVYFVQEYCVGGTLSLLLERRSNFLKAGTLSPNEIRFYVSQITSALNYLHGSCHVIHRGIDVSNIGIAWNGNVKLLGFGNAVQLPPLTDSARTTDRSILGPIHGTAPELLPPRLTEGMGDFFPTATNALRHPEVETAKFHSFEVDWWSLGVLIYRCLWGEYPFGTTETLTETDVAKRIVMNFRAKRNFQSQRYEILYFRTWKKTGILDLIEGLLEIDPDARWRKEDVEHCEFFSVIKDWSQLKEMRPPFVPVSAEVEADTAVYQQSQSKRRKNLKIGVFPEELEVRPEEEEVSYTHFTQVCQKVMREAFDSHTLRSKSILNDRLVTELERANRKNISNTFKKLQSGYAKKEARRQYQDDVFRANMIRKARPKT